MSALEFYFDCSSPWTYLAFENLQPIAVRFGQDIEWKPILVGGVFNEVNPSVYEARDNPVPSKARYYAKDLQAWADYSNLCIGRPQVFPVNSVKAMRGAFYALEMDMLIAYARRVFQAYWRDLEDISQMAVLERIVKSVGFPAQAFFDYIERPECKAALRGNTDELIRRGGFGSPSMFFHGQMYFGNDRLVLVESALARAHA